MLASETFGRSERARELLRYLVERQLAGEADRLKGFAIAIDVFGRDADFDPSTDAVVRVQAGRLRELLAQYYAVEGSAEPLRISIPRGSYVPTYEVVDAPDGSAAIEALDVDNAKPTERPHRPRRNTLGAAMPSTRHMHFFWASIALVIVMLGVVIVRQGALSPADRSEIAGVETAVATSSIAGVVSPTALPAVYIDVDANGPQAEAVAASLRAGLSGFDTIDFIGHDVGGSGPQPVSATSFVFRVLPQPSDDGILLELQNMATGRVLLSRRLQPANATPEKLEDRIAGILTVTVPAAGTIYNYIEQNDLQEGLTRCLLLDEKYYLDSNADSHGKAYRCLESLVKAGAKSPLIYSEIASLHMEAVTKHFPYPAGASADEAIAFARKAVQIGSTSASVHRANGYLNAQLGKAEAAIDWMRKAYELNTYDLGMGAAYGYSLIFAGRYAEGTPILARAIEASSAHPTWWDYGLFAGKFMLGDMAGATRAADALTTTQPKSHYLAARIISAKSAGDRDQARTLSGLLNSEFPKFAADPRKVFLERNYPLDLTDRLVKALRDAGIPNAS